MTKAEQLFQQIGEAMPDAKSGELFGALCLKARNGKSCVMFYKDEMVFKLPEDAANEAIRLKGAKVFDPVGGRPMNSWVQIPFTHADKWKDYAMQAMEFVKTLEK